MLRSFPKVVEVQAVTLISDVAGDHSFLRPKARPADRATIVSTKMIGQFVFNQLIRLAWDCVEFELAVDEGCGVGSSLVEVLFCSVDWVGVPEVVVGSTTGLAKLIATVG